MTAERAPGEDWLTFGSDVGLRRQWFLPASYAHPAKCNLLLLQWIIDRYSAPGDVLMDCMAGSGSLLLAATQQRHVILRDVEPRFLALMHDNAAHILRHCGLFAGSIDIADHDARQPWGLDGQVDAVITSPPYGCSASPNRAARKGWLERGTTLAAAGITHDDARWRQLANRPDSGAMGLMTFNYGEHPAQVGAFRGPRYWQAMEAVYAQAFDALRRGGYLVLVIKDHIYRGRRVCVADETVALCERLGFILHERHKRLVYPLSLWQRRRKERGEPVVEDEDVLCMVRP